MIEPKECDCGLGDRDWLACIDGLVYGSCTSEYCNGVCEYERDCTCPCHGEDDA